MQNEIRVLSEILKCFNKLMGKIALDDVEVFLVDGINQTIPYLEKKIQENLSKITALDDKNYADLDDLLRELHFLLHQYILDIERFDALWFKMWSTYYKVATVSNCISIEYVEVPDDTLMRNVFEQILKIILRFNKLDGKKIVYKKELDRIKDEIDQYASINAKLRTFINAVVQRDENDEESTTGYFLYIGGKLQDYCCILEFVRRALQKIVQEYSEKAEKMNPIQN